MKGRKYVISTRTTTSVSRRLRRAGGSIGSGQNVGDICTGGPDRANCEAAASAASSPIVLADSTPSLIPIGIEQEKIARGELYLRLFRLGGAKTWPTGDRPIGSRRITCFQVKT